MTFEKIEVRAQGMPTPPSPLSHAIVAGPFVFVSGQVPRNPATGETPDGIVAQTHQALQNVKAVLEASGSDLASVVKVSVHLANLADRDQFNAVYKEYFKPPYPARTAVGSQLGGILVEVECVAVIQGPARSG